jgi:hypothetical protein
MYPLTLRRMLLAMPILAAAMAIAPGWASAHFIWLAPQASQTDEVPQSLEVYFSESAAPDNPRLLDLLNDIKLWRLSPGRDPEPLQATRAGDSLTVMLSKAKADEQDSKANTHAGAVYAAAQDFGVRDKVGESFRLVYYAKAGPPAGSPLWQQVDASKVLKFDLAVQVTGGKVRLQATFDGSASATAEVTVLRPADADVQDELSGETDAEGKYAFGIRTAGRYSIRVRHIEQNAGEIGERVYKTVRHYATLTLDVPESALPLPAEKLGELPVTLTSFGAAVLDDAVYLYGGNTGSSHQYAAALQNNALMRLPLAGGEVETLARGPHLQGLALVAHDEKLMRIGGFEARNAEDEEHDLWSIASVSRFDPAMSQWSDLPPLPEPRSSFDAAVLGDTVYVIGGWAMAGSAPSQWHSTAWKMDLKQDKPEWVQIAAPPFERRALAVAAHGDKIYAIGGITSGDETSLDTDVYDPQTDRWSLGPQLVGESGMTGFGASAFATGGNLYISTISGTFQRLAADGSEWQVVGQMRTPRFFHRMLPAGSDAVIVVGGASMSGRITAVEKLKVSPQHAGSE